MKYTVIINDKSYDLPTYNLKISEKLEQVEVFKGIGTTIKEKLKKMYYCCADLLGKENAEEIMGKFEDSDPNMINISYLSIVESYNRPLAEFESERQEEQLNTVAFERLKDVLQNVKEVSALMDK